MCECSSAFMAYAQKYAGYLYCFVGTLQWSAECQYCCRCVSLSIIGWLVSVSRLYPGTLSTDVNQIAEFCFYGPAV